MKIMTFCCCCSSSAHRICGIEADFLLHGIGVLTQKEQAFMFSSNDPIGTDITGGESGL